MLDLRLKDEMVKQNLENPFEKIKWLKLNCPTSYGDRLGEVKEWQKTLDANKTARNKDFLDEYGKQVDWDKVEEKELEERKEFHKSV